MFPCVFYQLPIWCLGSGVVLNCIESSLVQDCVFTRSSEFQFGIRRKDRAKPWFGFPVRSSEKGSGLTLVWQVRGSEKGTGRTWFGRFGVRKGPNPGLAVSVFGEKTGLDPGSAGSEFGERSSQKPGLADSKFGERTWLKPDLEFGFGVRRKERAEPWFGRFVVWRKNLFFFL